MNVLESPPRTGGPTIWEEMRARGVSRRDFVKFCTWMSAYLGLRVERSRRRGEGPGDRSAGCRWSGCISRNAPAAASPSSARRIPIVADILLDKVSLDYTETLQAAAGFQAEECLQRHDEGIARRVPADGGGFGADGRRRRLLLHRRAQRRSRSSRRPPTGRRPSSPGATAPAPAASRPPSPIRRGPRRSTRSSPASRSSTCRAARRSPR